MRDKPKPFFGIAGLESSHQMEKIVEHALVNKINRRILTTAFMNSRSVRALKVNNEYVVHNPDALRNIFSCIYRPTREGPLQVWYDENLCRVVSFYSEGPAAADAELILADQKIHNPSGREADIPDKFVQAFYINGILPEADKLKWFQENNMWDRFEIILGIGERALRDAKHNADNLAVMIASYGESIDYVILEEAEDRNQLFDASAALPYLQAIRRHCPKLGLAVAGKLGPDTMYRIDPLIDEFPDLSVMAYKELRDENDHLVMPKVCKYLDICARKLAKKITYED